jgi:hypothetical protein
MSDTPAGEHLTTPLRTPSPQVKPTADEPAAPPAPAPPQEEVDLWWGAYAGQTMVPSLVFCLALTGFFAWLAWFVAPRGYVKVTFLSLGCVVWAVEAVRFCHRVFGFNYRLTSRRLFRDHGIFRPRPIRLCLDEVAQVILQRAGFERLLGVGHVLVMPADRRRPVVVLEGVRRPEVVADLLRRQVAKVRAERAAP